MKLFGKYHTNEEISVELSAVSLTPENGISSNGNALGINYDSETLSVNEDGKLVAFGGTGPTPALLSDYATYNRLTEGLEMLSTLLNLISSLIQPPAPCRNCFIEYDQDDPTKVKLTWNDPENTKIYGFQWNEWQKTIVVKNNERVPLSPEDGIVVVESTIRNKYSVTPFEDILENPAEWNYKAFPFTTSGKTTDKSKAFDINEIFGFAIDELLQEPELMVTYTGKNSDYRPLRVIHDGEDVHLDWGDWKDAWFMPKPCMLNYDGTVAYYLNPDNLALKEDGSQSDIANKDFPGNAMMEWVPVFYEAHRDADVSSTVYVNFSKTPREGYECWSARLSSDDKHPMYADHFYLPIFEGSRFEGENRVRSMATASNALTGEVLTAAYDACYENNKTSDGQLVPVNPSVGEGRWTPTAWVDEELLRLLGILVMKSTNSEEAIGTITLPSASPQIPVGSGINDGMFFGHKYNAVQAKGLKFFGMENWWGHRNRMPVGIVTGNISNIWYWYIKRAFWTPGNYTYTYALDFKQYFEQVGQFKSMSGFISKMTFGDIISMIPASVADSSSTTYYTDHAACTGASDASGTKVAVPCFGGNANDASTGTAGLFRTINVNVAIASNIGPSLSYHFIRGKEI